MGDGEKSLKLPDIIQSKNEIRIKSDALEAINREEGGMDDDDGYSSGVVFEDKDAERPERGNISQKF